MSKEEVISFFADYGFLVDPEFLDQIPESMDKNEILELLKDKNTFVINNETLQFINKEFQSVDESVIPRKNSDIEILESFREKPKKVEVQNFVSYFKSRYNQLKEILQRRNELVGAISINRLKGKANDRVALIGIISSKKSTKNNHLFLGLEDLTGKVNLLVSKNKDAYNLAKELVLDEVVGIIGNVGDNVIFVDQIFFPDIPVTKEFKKSPEELYAVFISDLHIGNKAFLKENFEKFISWINGENESDEQKKIAEKIGYLFIIGDLIEGVGIYPSQEKDLAIKDFYEQYKEFSKYLKQVPKRIKVIICPGNHDALRLDEPQPAIGENLIENLNEMENVFSLSNPSFVRIAQNETFEGFDVLIYHGESFTYYADAVDSIRLAGGLTRADLILKFLLQRRHLAPTHTSTSYLALNKDYHVISKVPDFFVSGHIHRCVAANYNNITMLNCSTWVPQSDYMEKRGIVPEPSKAILVNLKTRDVRIMDFSENAS